MTSVRRAGSSARAVILVGDVAADLVAGIGPVPQKWRSDSPPMETAAGGTVGNTACALTRLGVMACVVSAVGGDPFGAIVRQRLIAEGVDDSLLRTDRDRFTLVVVAVTGPSLDRLFWIHPATGAAPWSRVLARDDRDAIAHAGWLHASGSGLGEEILAATTLEAMAVARDSAVPISLDLNLRPHGDGVSDTYLGRLRKAIELSDVVLGSGEDEVTAVAGLEDPLVAARELSHGRRTVVVRLGRDGAYVVPAGRFAGRAEAQLVPGYGVDVVSTLGAGDVFNAGLIAALLGGADIVDAARTGNAAAAVACTELGAYSAVGRAAVDALLGRSTTAIT